MSDHYVYPPLPFSFVLSYLVYDIFHSIYMNLICERYRMERKLVLDFDLEFNRYRFSLK